MVIMGFDTCQAVREHFAAAIAGEIPRNIGGHASVETRYDPTLPRIPGHHVSFFQIHAPYDVPGGWDEQGPILANELSALWKRSCPNLVDENIVMRSIETPVDIETRLTSMVRGSIKHGDYHPLQMGVFRPHDSCVAGRSPIEGLYLCGASSYPGGLVIGGPGYIAAGSVVEDLDVAKWWSPPQYVQRYSAQYMSS
jgi:phytoene dehydrogenase-like protein